MRERGREGERAALDHQSKIKRERERERERVLQNAALSLSRLARKKERRNAKSVATHVQLSRPHLLFKDPSLAFDVYVCY
jgi:hypothetical protein